MHRNSFIKEIGNIDRLQNLASTVSFNTDIDCQIISFSSNKDLSEQALSILSFIRYVGNPSSWIIYSDGTHTAAQIVDLESTFPFLSIVEEKFSNFENEHYFKPALRPYKKELIHYATTAPLGKKLLFYLNFEVNKPTIFLDSDIIFYDKASCLRTLIQDNVNGWFLPDAGWGTLDSRYLNSVKPMHYQANSGFFIAFKNFEIISDGLEFLKSMDLQYEYFSEQTVLHILILGNQFMPLDPRVFAMDTSDQFTFSYLHPLKNIALRHYTNPVRHKMWQKNWKWHLSI